MLKLRPDLPVCYVLNERHLSNLLVLITSAVKLGCRRIATPAGPPRHCAAIVLFLSATERGRLVPESAQRSLAAAQVTGQNRGRRFPLDVQLVR